MQLKGVYGGRQFKTGMKMAYICRVFILIFVIIVCFSACTSKKPLYSWGSYENQVYLYMRGESREAQIAALERDKIRIEARGGIIPPGFYAHLGMLYVEIGDAASAIALFEAEKALFPEAAVYMNFILENLRR